MPTINPTSRLSRNRIGVEFTLVFALLFCSSSYGEEQAIKQSSNASHGGIAANANNNSLVIISVDSSSTTNFTNPSGEKELREIKEASRRTNSKLDALADGLNEIKANALERDAIKTLPQQLQHQVEAGNPEAAIEWYLSEASRSAAIIQSHKISATDGFLNAAALISNSDPKRALAYVEQALEIDEESLEGKLARMYIRTEYFGRGIDEAEFSNLFLRATNQSLLKTTSERSLLLSAYIGFQRITRIHENRNSTAEITREISHLKLVSQLLEKKTGKSDEFLDFLVFFIEKSFENRDISAPEAGNLLKGLGDSFRKRCNDCSLSLLLSSSIYIKAGEAEFEAGNLESAWKLATDGLTLIDPKSFPAYFATPYNRVLIEGFKLKLRLASEINSKDIFLDIFTKTLEFQSSATLNFAVNQKIQGRIELLSLAGSFVPTTPNLKHVIDDELLLLEADISRITSDLTLSPALIAEVQTSFSRLCFSHLKKACAGRWSEAAMRSLDALADLDPTDRAAGIHAARAAIQWRITLLRESLGNSESFRTEISSLLDMWEVTFIVEKDGVPSSLAEQSAYLYFLVQKQFAISSFSCREASQLSPDILQLVKTLADDHTASQWAYSTYSDSLLYSADCLLKSPLKRSLLLQAESLRGAISSKIERRKIQLERHWNAISKLLTYSIESDDLELQSLTRDEIRKFSASCAISPSASSICDRSSITYALLTINSEEPEDYISTVVQNGVSRAMSAAAIYNKKASPSDLREFGSILLEFLSSGSQRYPEHMSRAELLRLFSLSREALPLANGSENFELYSRWVNEASAWEDLDTETPMALNVGAYRMAEYGLICARKLPGSLLTCVRGDN